jgi:hypothetical protein
MLTEVRQEKTDTTLDEVKNAIITFLRNSPEFTQAPYQDLQFASLTGDRILVNEYQDYDDNLCLVINIAVPDKAYPSYEKKDILEFMRHKAKPVINSLVNDLQVVKDIALNYHMVNIFFRSETEFNQLKG